MDETIRTIIGMVLGGVIGVLIVYGLHIMLSSVLEEVKRIGKRQEDLEQSYTNFLQEFKELLLSVMEKQRQDQVDTKDKDNG